MADASLEIVTDSHTFTQDQVNMLSMCVHTLGVPCYIAATPDRKEFYVLPAWNLAKPKIVG